MHFVGIGSGLLSDFFIFYTTPRNMFNQVTERASLHISEPPGRQSVSLCSYVIHALYKTALVESQVRVVTTSALFF